MAVSINNVSKYYGRQKALNNISFTLNSGEICGFLGPNGAGKSTLMKIITGYLDEYEGDIIVNGKNLRQYPLEVKAATGYLPEHNPLYPDMYITEYLLHVTRLYRTPNAMQRVNEIMEMTGLLPEKNKKIGQLSKGYRQRTGLAQALIHEPDLLILDEPMTGLDPNQLEEIRDLIIRIGKNKTVLLSTHIMQEVEAICDRILVIDKGNLIADKPKSVFHHTGSGGMVLKVSFAPGNPTDWLSEIKGISQIKRDGNDSFRLLSLPGHDPRIALFEAAAGHHCPIIELREESNLEDIFKELTGKNNSLHT